MNKIVLFSQVRFKNPYYQLGDQEKKDFLAKIRFHFEEQKVKLISEYRFITGEYEKFLVYELEDINSMEILQKKLEKELNYKIYVDVVHHIGYKTN